MRMTQLLAFAMVRHQRLGASSPAADLDTDCMRCIRSFVHAAHLEVKRDDDELISHVSTLQAFGYGIRQEDVQQLRDMASNGVLYSAV